MKRFIIIAVALAFLIGCAATQTATKSESNAIIAQTEAAQIPQDDPPQMSEKTKEWIKKYITGDDFIAFITGWIAAGGIW